MAMKQIQAYCLQIETQTQIITINMKNIAKKKSV